MESQDEFVKIGILTMPSDINAPKTQGQPDQYVLDINRYFVQLSGTAKAVPLRYDLYEDKEKLMQTLNELDGVLFTGGHMPIRELKEAPASVKLFYATAKHTFEYAIASKMPILAICQGF